MKRRPALIPGRLPRVRRIDSARVAARKGLTHERIAVNLGISPMRLVLLCERHGIDVRRAPGRVIHPPADTAAMDKRARAAEGRKVASEERAERARVDRETFGGYELVQGRMVWKPGRRKVCPAFTTASLYRPNGEPIENVAPPLASLGEVEPEKHAEKARKAFVLDRAKVGFGTFVPRNGTGQTGTVIDSGVKRKTRTGKGGKFKRSHAETRV